MGKMQYIFTFSITLELPLQKSYLRDCQLSLQAFELHFAIYILIVLVEYRLIQDIIIINNTVYRISIMDEFVVKIDDLDLMKDAQCLLSICKVGHENANFSMSIKHMI